MGAAAGIWHRARSDDGYAPARMGRDFLYAEGGGGRPPGMERRAMRCRGGNGRPLRLRRGIADGGHAYEVGGVFEELHEPLARGDGVVCDEDRLRRALSLGPPSSRP